MPVYIAGYFYVAKILKRSGLSDLMESAAEGDVPKKKLLFAKGADVNETDSSGAIALMFAFDWTLQAAIGMNCPVSSARFRGEWHAQIDNDRLPAGRANFLQLYGGCTGIDNPSPFQSG